MSNQFFLWVAFVAPCRGRKKNSSYGITHIFFSLIRNILRIWHSYDIFILLVIIIGLAFVMILNFYLFKSFSRHCSYFPKNCWLSSFISSLEASAGVGHSFLSFLMGLFIDGLCRLCWLLLLLLGRLLLFFSFFC